MVDSLSKEEQKQHLINKIGNNVEIQELYSRIYRCEDCKDCTNPIGVHYFVNGNGNPSSSNYLPITIPVANFGDVINAKVWVVVTNPAGDRVDPLVGLSVKSFKVNSRSQLNDEDIKKIFDFQCNYFKHGKDRWHPFFFTFYHLLNGIKIGNEPISFEAGDVCFVDAIKCPTQKAWMGYVMTAEGKRVWDNCLRKKNKFLEKQLLLHKPEIVLYWGTSGLIKAKIRGKKAGESSSFSKKLKLTTRHVYSEGKLNQISIDFTNTKFNSLPRREQMEVRNYISNSITI